MKDVDINIIAALFDGTIDAFRRSHGDTAKANAHRIASAIDAYPWLRERAPRLLLTMAERVASSADHGLTWGEDGGGFWVEYEQPLTPCDGSGRAPSTAVRQRKTFRRKDDGSFVLLSIADVGSVYPLKAAS